MSNAAAKAAKPDIKDPDFFFTWFPYLPSFLCYIPAIAMLFWGEALPEAVLAMLLAGSGLSILGTLIVRLRQHQLELRQELHETRQTLVASQNNSPE